MQQADHIGWSRHRVCLGEDDLLLLHSTSCVVLKTRMGSLNSDATNTHLYYEAKRGLLVDFSCPRTCNEPKAVN